MEFDPAPLSPTTGPSTPGDLDALFETSTLPRCLVDEDGVLLRASRSLAGLVGEDAQALAGLALVSICASPGRPEVAVALDAARAGWPSGVEARVQLGERLGPEISWLLAPDGAGRVHAVGRPVSGGGRLQRLLAETQRTAAIGGWELDFITGELFWTDETYRLHEVDPESYRPTVESAVAFYTADSLPRISQAVEAGRRHGTPWDLELQIVTAGGRTRDVRAVGRVEHRDGEPVRAHGSFQDITERRLLEEQLRHSQKLEGIGRLAGGVAHDFNNLLTVILGNLDLIDGGAGAGPVDPKALEAIREAAEQACHVTGQLLAFARKRVRAPEPIALGRRVLELTALLEPLLGESGELVVDVEGGEAVVSMDPGQLELVLVNLVVNARDAMPEGGRVRVEVRETERSVRLSIEDTGTGIEPEDLSKIFEPFFTTKEPERGTGLGLATCHGIVEQNRGTIHAESWPGVGTTFRIVLPRDLDAPLPVVELAPTPRPIEAARTRTILLIEDEPLVLDLVRQLLEREGYRVVAAASGGDALGLLEHVEGPVDAVVTDLALPGAGGRDLIAAVRERLGPLPALVMSGYQDEPLERAPGGEVEAFLEKPFTSRDLAETVASLFAGA